MPGFYLHSCADARWHIVAIGVTAPVAAGPMRLRPLKGDSRRSARSYQPALSGGLFAHQRLAALLPSPATSNHWGTVLGRGSSIISRGLGFCNAMAARASGQPAGRRRCAQVGPAAGSRAPSALSAVTVWDDCARCSESRHCKPMYRRVADVEPPVDSAGNSLVRTGRIRL